MLNPTEKLQQELAAEKQELLMNSLLTALSLLGLLAGVFGTLFSWSPLVVLVCFTISYLAGGYSAVKSAGSSLLEGKLNIDLLMVLAALAAAGVGEVRDGAILLFLFSLAGTLEEYAMGNTKRAVISLMKLRPNEATLQLSTGQTEKISVEKLKIGDIVLVKPGEKMPVDGTIQSGNSAVDQSPVTGESVPVEKGPADKVFAGSVNGNGVLLVEVTKLATESTLSQMIKLVTEAQAKRSPSESFSDWFGARYTFVVLLGSALALGVFILIGLPYAEAFYKAATLLVVASPCAIVISVPAAILSALASSAKRGMLFKGGAALEIFGQIDIVAFDKTGTLTKGEMQVTDFVNIDSDRQNILAIAMALESQSEHPLAKSIIEYGVASSAMSIPVSETVAVPGKGIKASIGTVNYWAGNRKMLSDSGIVLNAQAIEALSRFESEGKTVIIIGDSKDVLGIFAIADTVRDSSAAAIAALLQSGVKKVVMLTGDHLSVAQAVAKTLGIPAENVYADLMPEDKVRVINDLRQQGKVAFVGDGVNDAAALATAHVGVAMGTAGSDVALEAADVALLSNDMKSLIRARELSVRTNNIIKQNLVFAVGILLLMVVITVFFYLPLPLGVIGHEGGTLLVVLNGLRLLILK